MPKPQLPTLDDDVLLKRALESLLFISDRPLPLAKLCDATGVKDESRISAVVDQIKSEMEAADSPLQVVMVAEGFQMATRPAFAPYIRKLFAERMTMRLSRAAHETLAIIAYRQPLTRAEIEAIRGVDVIAALETLLEKGLVKVVGRRESVGRPLMYGTTMDFLRHFGLKSLEELPPIEKFVVPTSQPLSEDLRSDGAASSENAAAPLAEIAPPALEASVSEPAQLAAAEEPASSPAPEDPTAKVWPD